MKKQFKNLVSAQVNNRIVFTYNTKKGCVMKILEEIALNYKKLFDKTGMIEFFMHAKNIEKLNNDIIGVDKQEIATNEEIAGV